MSVVYNQLTDYAMQAFDDDFDALLNQLQGSAGYERLLRASQAFLGLPYMAGACGEGEMGEFDQSPPYRNDCFDCVTFVNTVLALMHAADLAEFKQAIVAVNYYQSKPCYLSRFHFMSADWMVENAIQGVIEDITYTVIDKAGGALQRDAQTTIDKPNWLRYRSLEDIKLLGDVAAADAMRRLDDLHRQASLYHCTEVVTPYLALDDLFDRHGQHIDNVLEQIPLGSLLLIVRPNWDLRQQIGTCLNVSHIGFVVDVGGELVYRQASSVEGGVCDVPLIDYLKRCVKSPTIAGINLQMPTCLVDE